MLESRLGTLERYIADSLSALMSKQRLVEHVRIDPDSFELSLLTHAGASLAPDRLSAGERQMLAVSILWGLARASGRRLPVVVDTPMGRLDSEHRLRLVDRYLPTASHQVIVLSTDEELDAGLFGRMRPNLGRSYLLKYDEDRRCSSVHPGYFWDACHA